MSVWTRIVNAFDSGRLNRELDEEMRLHIEEAVAAGRSEEEARRAFGNLLLLRERSRDAHVLAWLEALVADVRFGARQLRKNWIVSVSAVLSLALAIGACTGAFRLIDAMLLRPLPVAHPERWQYATFSYVDQSGTPQRFDSVTYPLLSEMRAEVKDDATLLAVGSPSPIDITFGGDAEIERATRQYVSGGMFPAFGLGPALGRLLGPEDDRKPGAHPVAVLSHHYWTSRFGRDRGVLGRKFRTGETLYEIVGVAPEGFTGTEPGAITSLFIPAMMNTRAIGNANWAWFRLWVGPAQGQHAQPLLDRLQAVFSAHRRERLKEWNADTPKQLIDQYLSTRLELRPAANGASQVRDDSSRALIVLGILVALVLLIACANVANLLLARTAAREREMALRVSIGAGRWRLIQSVLVESALLAAAATALGALFAWWSAPWVVSQIPDLNLVLPAGWRVLGFAALLAAGVTLLFGLAPALRASRIQPASALKGGDNARPRLRMIHALVAGQVAFCFVVHYSASLLVPTFQRLSQQPLGFSPARVALLEIDVKRSQDVPPGAWERVVEALRAVPGVESAAVCSWGLMSGNAWTGEVRIAGRAPDPAAIYFFSSSPGFLRTMGIPLVEGRDIAATDGNGEKGDTRPAAAVVTESFARHYFGAARPVGKFFERDTEGNRRIRYEIVGLVKDLRYRTLREPPRPVVFVPGTKSDWGTFAVRTRGADPLMDAASLRAVVSRTRPDFRVSGTDSQQQLVDQWSVRERLLAELSVFFAAVALLLAGIGLYGVLSYSVVRRTREIGIRMALGARSAHVVVRITARVLAMLGTGAAIGLAAGLSSGKILETLLYETKPTDLVSAAVPLSLLLAAALLAAVPPALRAIRVDPATALRSE